MLKQLLNIGVAVNDIDEAVDRYQKLFGATVVRAPEDNAPLNVRIAIVQVGTESFVWRVGDGGKVARATVEVGSRQDGQAEILSGLSAGDRIVVDGTGKLRPGSVVVDAGNDADADADPPTGG